MTQAVREKFNKAVEAGKHKNESVAAGREYVEAYVTFMHDVEGIHTTLMSTGAHQHAEPPKVAGAHEHPGNR